MLIIRNETDENSQILKFKQCDWMKTWIWLALTLKKEKLQKMIIYVRKYVSKPTFISQKNFNENFAAIHEIKPVLVLNKPMYVGFTLLELSKYN